MGLPPRKDEKQCYDVQMTGGLYRFDRFTLDLRERQLRIEDDGNGLVELSGRYLDALALMVAEPGKLIAKDRFMGEVWRGIPVTDEALTQCIRSLRKALGDDAARPRFIETVPKYGYRFIAAVVVVAEPFAPPHNPSLKRSGFDEVHPPLLAEQSAGTAASNPPPSEEGDSDSGGGEGPLHQVEAGASAPMQRPAHPSLFDTLNLSDSGLIRPLIVPAALAALGGGVAGGTGGLIYGFGAVSQPLGPGMGQASVLLVLICICILVGTAGGGAVGLGVASAARLSSTPWRWATLGGAMGGMIVGALVKMLGLDAFNLLLGRAPSQITGGGEGMLIGGAVGLGLTLAARGASRAGHVLSPRRAMAWGTMAGGIMGALLPIIGGRLMAGSLASLTQLFPDSRLRFDALGKIFGESGFGPVSQMVTGALEGSLFGACVAGALALGMGQVRHT